MTLSTIGGAGSHTIMQCTVIRHLAIKGIISTKLSSVSSKTTFHSFMVNALLTD
ncbi:TPA: hypothetical protein ACSPKR_003157 [Providencia rettgeri]